MTLSLSTGPADLGALDTPLLVVALPAGATVDATLAPLDRTLGSALTRTLERRDFRGGRDETLHLTGAATGPRRVLLIGLGTPAARAGALRRAGAIAARHGGRMGVGALAFYAGPLDATETEALAVGLAAGAWEYTDTKTPPPADERRDPLISARILGGNAAGLTSGIAIAEGHGLARTLGMMPGNLCTPELLAQTARDIGARHGLTVTVQGRAEMEQLGMGSFLCVAQGTPQDPKLITLEYLGGAKGAPPVALVGKGLCFDSGGISIKPAQGMEWMKFDMCGAAGVLGAMEAIARLNLPINVVGLIGATTNMPSGTAVKPGDVVKSMSGKYIEIINTDAEGRLVLADALAYARALEGDVLVDNATLTGACVVALGKTCSGFYATTDRLAGQFAGAAKDAGEQVWRMPLLDDLKDQLKSDLKEFADEFPWVHLDVAGTAYTEADLPTVPRGPTGIPVGTFVEFVRGRAG